MHRYDSRRGAGFKGSNRNESLLIVFHASVYVSVHTLCPYTHTPVLGGDWRLTIWFVTSSERTRSEGGQQPLNAHSIEGEDKRTAKRTRIQRKNHRKSTPKSTPNRRKVDAKSLLGLGSDLGRLGTLRFGSAPGRSRDVLGRPQGPPGRP